MRTETLNPLPESKLTKSQVKTFGPKHYTEGPDRYKITVKARYDDCCGNGHNSFGLTAEILCNGRDYMGGCCHDEIAKHFPELVPFIKWHLTSSEGPMHYVANTTYHALEHGPKSAWVYFDDPENGIKKQCMKYCGVEEAHEMCAIPSKTFNYVSGVGYRLEIDEKTAKERDLAAARSCAVWPEATDEELTAPGLEERLLARLPALMVEFKKAMESLGFTY
jgi:hypothetical protein